MREMIFLFTLFLLMCTNMKYIYNKYINRAVYVPCGKCEACRQQKANYRANRIRNDVRLGSVHLFVTLTYKPDSIPYIERKDLYSKSLELPVYRDSDYRFVRSSGDYHISEKRYSGKHFIDSLNISQDFYDDPFYYYHIVNAPHPHGSSKDKIGVLYYRDLQNFQKRLKQNLSRNYGISNDYGYYQCSEYGETTFRPHFHLLIRCPSKDIEAYKQAIVKSWPFADRNRTADYIEVARDASKYVASYINKPVDFPELFKNATFRQKHSYSQGYGKGLACFSLSQILEKVREGALTYNVEQVKDGVPCLTSFIIPKYVINRFFPKFKGYSRLTDDSLSVVLRAPQRLRHFGWIERFSDGDIHKISVSLKNAYQRYKYETGKSYEDYIIDFLSTWRCHSSTLYKQFMLKCEEDNSWTTAYDNLNELVYGFVDSPNLRDLYKDVSDICLNPNSFEDRQRTSRELMLQYHYTIKQRKVVNLVMDRLGCYT